MTARHSDGRPVVAVPARTAAKALSSTENVDDSPRQKTTSKLFRRFSFLCSPGAVYHR
jgi:hypothetical protein